MASAEGADQTLFIIRHGERIDHVDDSWVHTSPRPYDPPLTGQGEKQAEIVAEEFVDKTAQKICSKIEIAGMHMHNGIMDVLNKHCMIYEQPQLPASDLTSYGISLLSNATDPAPKFPEKTKSGLKRLDSEFKKIADQHYPNTVLIVTHGYGVSQGFFMSKGCIYQEDGVWADYCGFVELKRSSRDNHKWDLIHYSKDVEVTGRYAHQ